MRKHALEDIVEVEHELDEHMLEDRNKVAGGEVAEGVIGAEHHSLRVE